MAAIVGAAGLAPCLAAASAGKRLLLANKEALVVGGCAVRPRRGKRRRDAAADRQRALGDPPVPAARSLDLARPRRAHRPHRVGRSVPGPRPGHAHASDSRRGVRAPELGDGPQDLGRLGDDDEQGARGDRGALPVRPRARADRGRHPPAEHRPLDGRLPRPVGAGAARHAGHARADRLRSRLSRPDRLRRRTRSTGARWRRSPSSRPTFVSIPASASRGTRCVRRPDRRPSSTPPTRRRWPRFSPELFPSIGFTRSIAAPSNRFRPRRALPIRSSRCSRSTTRRVGAPASS